MGDGVLEYKDLTPINLCKEELRLKVQNLKNGESLPSERQLVEELGVSRSTLRSALQTLRDEGIILSQERQGMHVNKKVNISMLGMNSMSSQIVSNTSDRSTHIQFLNSQVVPASEKMTNFFHIKKNTALIKISRSRTFEDHPATFETAFLLKEKYEKLLTIDFTDQSLYKVLDRTYHTTPAYGHEEIGYTLADKLKGEILKVPIDTPLYQVSSFTFDSQDTPIEYTKQYLVSNFFKYSLYAKNVLDYQEDDDNESF
ncbi:GntR family transcriptional regulator [Pediococcus cellicola]|uniref:GntR family transcriptional regulator n=1 Tax=Pediococcus cellicola TaxID=319652 RepID=A0A0R2IJ53_9LACO|nr:GntR family transcriptional regulator [Pediococcus cellicola]